MLHANLIDEPWDAQLTVMPRAELCDCPAMKNAAGDIFELQLTTGFTLVLDHWQAKELHDLLSGPLNPESRIPQPAS